MPLDERQTATVLMQLQAANVNAVHAGEDTVVVAKQLADAAEREAIAAASEPPKKKKGKSPDKPDDDATPVVVVREPTGWMVPRATGLATDIGIVQFRAGQIVDDMQLKGELERGGIVLIPVYGDR